MASARLQLRNAVRRDLAQILIVETECFAEHAYTPDLFRHYLRSPNSIFVVALCGDAIVGYTAGIVDRRFRPQAARLDSIAVRPKHSRYGAGTALLKRFEKLAILQGCHRIILQVSVRNDTALHLYRRFGYQITYCLTDYYGRGHDAVEMVKTLSSRRIR